MSYTSGPWEMSSDGAEIWPTTGPASNVELARVVGPWCESSWYDRDTAQANGRLIAAAPELLVALRLCRKLLAEWVDSGSADQADSDAVRIASAAIAKAEGRGE